jgi:CO dehydrogenase/acetyl-CoA synthase beta subunit
MAVEFFDRHFDDILFNLQRMRELGKISEGFHRGDFDWPLADKGDLVMGVDTAVELGHPKEGSMAFLIWTSEPMRLKNKRISVLGPDLHQLGGKRIPFGKIILLGVEGFNEGNSYERYRQLENVRYDIHLKGYMMRGVSQYGREWSRVSRKAIEDGFSLPILGGTLVDRYLDFEFVQTVEVVFFTSGLQDMKPFLPIAENALKIIGAMNKMIEEVSYDCDTCEYNEVCGEVKDLRALRRSLQKRGKTTDD